MSRLNDKIGYVALPKSDHEQVRLWPLGRVMECEIIADEPVSTVNERTAKAILRRDVHRVLKMVADYGGPASNFSVGYNL